MPLQSEDLKFGKENENASHNDLNDYLKTKLIKNENDFGVIDFYNKDKSIYVELKSRRIKHNDYNTAIVGTNKIKFLSGLKCESYIAYKYVDGLFIIKYDKDLFNTFEVEKKFKRSYRPDVGHTETMSITHIPYTKLTKIN